MDVKPQIARHHTAFYRWQAAWSSLLNLGDDDIAGQGQNR